MVGAVSQRVGVPQKGRVFMARHSCSLGFKEEACRLVGERKQSNAETVNEAIRRAFTLLELLVVVGIIALLIAVLLPSLNRARENANRSKCGTNLHAIGRALTLYAASESDMFPAQPPPDGSIGYGIGLWNNPPNPAAWPDSAEEAIRNDFDTSSGGWYPQMGEPIANLWLLVLRGNVVPKQFICPSDPTIPRVSVVSFGPPQNANVVYNDNFGAGGTDALVGNFENTFSYSFAYPWYADLTDPGKWWKSTMDGSLPIGSDIRSQ